MNKFYVALASLAIAVLAIAAAPAVGQRVKYEMLNCPAELVGKVDELGQPVCRPPQATQCSARVCTGAAPTDAGDGMSLQGITAFRITVCAPTYYLQADGGLGRFSDAGLDSLRSETLQGDGGLLIYGFNGVTQRWAYDPDLSRGMNIQVSGQKCQEWPDFQVGGQFDRVKVVPNAIFVQMADAGYTDAGLDIMLDGQSSPFPQWN